MSPSDHNGTPRVKAAFLALLLTLAGSLWAEEMVFRFYPEEKFKIIQRADVRHTIDGKYKGLIAREVRGILERDPFPLSSGGFGVTGQYYVMEDLYQSGLGKSRALEETQATAFTLLPRGPYLFPEQEESSYPLLRGFPHFPEDPVSPGDTWIASSERIHLSPFTGRKTQIPLLCEYTYTGTGEYQGEKVYIIQARYATRYRQGQDSRGDRDLLQMSGSHEVTIYMGPDGPLFMRDNMFEDLRYSGGRSYSEKGFILTFYKGIQGMDRRRLAETLRQQIDREIEKEGLSEQEKETLEVTEKEEGVSLNLADLLFVPDQAELLPGEEAKLNAMARILGRIDERTFLVAGHTAPFGDPQFLKELSRDRAKAIVDALVARGIPASRFLYEGRGSAEQIAPNDTPENRSRNRRVEIIILED